MHRKILGICAALVALGAFTVLPAMSSAATLKDTVGGVLTAIPAGAKIKAISEETAVFTAGELSVQCNENYMTGTVHRNTGGAAGIIEGTIEDARFQGPESETRCSSSLGATRVTIPALTNETGGTGHWCIVNNVGADTFQVFGRNCTEAGAGTLTFRLDIGAITCIYTRGASVSGTYTTNSHPAATTLSVTGNPAFTREAGSSFLCPANGNIQTMKFNLYTDTYVGTTAAETSTDPASVGDPISITNP